MDNNVPLRVAPTQVSPAPSFDLTHWLADSHAASDDVRRQGFALLSAAGIAAVAGVGAADLTTVQPSWASLPPDEHLRDGGRYRFRRHASYTIDNAAHFLHREPHRAHWQPREYNALHGGIERMFEPIDPALDQHPAWAGLITGLGRLFSAVQPAARWYVEAHQFRIDTAAGIGRPTPEGAHRDGVDYVAVVVIARHRIKGGETRVFEGGGNRGVRFTIDEPWSALLLDDDRVIHETTPIQPADDASGHRDTLVVTYRANGFLSAETA